VRSVGSYTKITKTTPRFYTENEQLNVIKPKKVIIYRKQVSSGHQKSLLFMKKVIFTLFVIAFTAFLFTSCASSKRGYGCPTSQSNKPFRA
jgi:hypothetical protein